MIATILSLGSLEATRFILPVAGSYAVLWLALSPWTPLQFFSPSSDISYGVYLYGWPAQKLLLWHFPAIPLGLQTVLALSSSLLLGWASWNVIEKRALAFKARLADRPAQNIAPPQPALPFADLDGSVASVRQ